MVVHGGFLVDGFGAEDGVLAGHTSSEGPLQLGLQGELQEALRLLAAGHVSLLQEALALEPGELIGVVFDLGHDGIGRRGHRHLRPGQRGTVRVGRDPMRRARGTRRQHRTSGFTGERSTHDDDEDDDDENEDEGWSRGVVGYLNSREVNAGQPGRADESK